MKPKIFQLKWAIFYRHFCLRLCAICWLTFPLLCIRIIQKFYFINTKCIIFIPQDILHPTCNSGLLFRLWIIEQYFLCRLTYQLKPIILSRRLVIQRNWNNAKYIPLNIKQLLIPRNLIFLVLKSVTIHRQPPSVSQKCMEEVEADLYELLINSQPTMLILKTPLFLLPT